VVSGSMLLCTLFNEMLLFLVCVFSVFATGNRPQELPKVASTIFQQTERDHSV